MKILLLLTAVLVCFTTSSARILHVPANYTTIQSAINASVNGDTVLVAPGTYQENVIFRGKRIVLTSRFYLDANPSSIIQSTIIDGSNPSHPDSGSCVRIANGEDSTTILQGFTLTRGYGTLWQDENGAGRYWEGGGVLIALSSPTVRHNIIRNNDVNRTGGQSTGGGGIRLGDGSPYILNNIIINNAGMYGGGIVSNYASPTIRNNIVAYNVVSPAVAGRPTYGGGGMWVNGSRPGATFPNRIENNTIVGNSATGSGGSGAGGKGGGMLAAFSATINSRNNIVWGNTQTTGGQLNIASGSSVIATYSDVEGGYAGSGNINVTPNFAPTSFYLQTGSQCIDAGDTTAAFNDLPDLTNPGVARWPSLGGLRNDIGAYGGPGAVVIATILTSAPARGDGIAAEFSLEQNYPNPFNPSTSITYYLPEVGGRKSEVGYVTLKVFDMLGREVATLVNEVEEPGTYTVQWNASSIASGVYLYQLSAGEFVQTRKLMVVR
ncbi:MAG: T9SS type A sorting domain-containing protein [Ignavibacteriae bacterium]|nr:T9SS type A sorting domain-containing protein [Ignavibacteriota bacterium]